MSSRHRPLVLVAAIVVSAAVAAGCGDDDGGLTVDLGTTSGTGQERGCAVAGGGQVTVVAEDLAWDVDCIQAPEGVDLTILVDNRDHGVNHNLHIPDLPDDPTTELAAGPVVQELDLGADLVAGEYEYVCDIHPTMTGTLEILEPLSGGSDRSSPPPALERRRPGATDHSSPPPALERRRPGATVTPPQ